jgi:hypothetical protein
MEGMKPIPDLDPETTERMLSGALEPDDAPPGYADVVRVLRATTAPPERTSAAREAWAVAAGQQIADEERMDLSAGVESSSVRSNYLRAKVVTVVTVGTLLGTGGMAMAGALPASLQDAASKVFDKVGITVPLGHPASTGPEISGIATSTTETGAAKGQQISTIASGGMSQAGQHGQAGQHAPSSHANPHATTPHGGNGAAHGTSNGASDHGSSTASSHSHGGDAAASGHASSHSPAH